MFFFFLYKISMTAPDKKNLISDTIYIAKGIGIFLVVIGHYCVPGFQPEGWKYLRDLIYTFHMPLFMVLSGFLYSRYLKFDNSSIKNYFRYISKRCNRLFFPYITLSVLIIGSKIIAGQFFDVQYPVKKDFLYYFIFNPTLSGAGLLWYIYTLMIINIIYPIFKIFLNDIFVAVFAVVILYFATPPNIFCAKLVLYYLPYFAAGCVIADKKILEQTNLKRLICYCICSLIFFAGLFYLDGFFKTEFQKLILKYLEGFSGAFAAIFVSCVIANSKPILDLRVYEVIKNIGIYSPSIYLLHTLFMGPVKVFFMNLPDFSRLFVISILPVCAAGLVMPVLVEKYFIAPYPLASKLILGSVSKKTA